LRIEKGERGDRREEVFINRKKKWEVINTSTSTDTVPKEPEAWIGFGMYKFNGSAKSLHFIFPLWVVDLVLLTAVGWWQASLGTWRGREARN
jgi:hypothetical protein